VRARTAPPDGSLSAIILDIDNFKQINDFYGHETGDEAICVCARAAFLHGAVVGRLGGDEFALLLEQQTLPQAVEVAEDLRLQLAEQPFDTGKGRITLTWSVDQILARADAALYKAKLGGRNRVVGAYAGVLMRAAVASDGLARVSAL
jgi:diguanylate cyclase (GGDEF)-like protein